MKIKSIFDKHPAFMIFAIAAFAFAVSHILNITGFFEAWNHATRDEYIQELKTVIQAQERRIKLLERRVYEESNWHVCAACTNE
jgi:hypothetical protein